MSAASGSGTTAHTGVCEPFVRRDGRLLPRYNDGLTMLAPGLYLGLFHGRDAIDEILEDWGFDGPVIGPLESVHTTYAADVKLRFADGRIAGRHFPETGFVTNVATGERTRCVEASLNIADDLLVFDGRYFGDWTVFYVAQR
ncbi:hypothetical protein DPV79_27145 [Burkholderia reimsis]|uniref:Uncharacterized protein n=1 Tax=Burkholderia reimsis TaxID=2234132 RepID=A0A365QQE0_9BURK|nr:hypothetical protein [Burkholderia reimsis]RBB35699.1 hypothetical protein DPV79_27145 [Burkholderia reimsis]